MRYIIETTNIFDKWLHGIKNAKTKARIISRLDRVQLGNFGDHKNIEKNIYELRFFLGAGYRIYYTKKNKIIILLLCGGDKSSQKNDIIKAREILAALERNQ